MKALILAAGEAKRLKPITENLPKCLLKVAGKSIIDYQIESLQQAGITEAVVVTGFLAEKIEQHLTKTHPRFTFIFIVSIDYYKTYPAHGLWLAQEYLTEEILYLNADVICHPDIIKSIVDSPDASITAIQRTSWDEEEVNVILKNKSNKITEIGKHISKDLSHGEFVGVTKLGKDFNAVMIGVLTDFIEREEFKKFAADAINLTIQRGQHMHILDVSNLPAIEIDTEQDLIEAGIKVQEIQFS